MQDGGCEGWRFTTTKVPRLISTYLSRSSRQGTYEHIDRLASFKNQAAFEITSISKSPHTEHNRCSCGFRAVEETIQPLSSPPPCHLFARS